MASALVLSGHLSLVRSLAKKGIDVVSVEYQAGQPGRWSRYAQTSLRIPDPLQNEAAFISSLLDVGPRFAGSVVFPMWDEALVACSKHKAALSEFYLVGADDWPTTQVFVEKSRTAELAASLGIPQPLTATVDSVEMAESVAQRLSAPFLVKPIRTDEFQRRFGSKMFPIKDSAELSQAVSRCLEAGVQVMVQEFIPGIPSDGAVYAGYFDRGEPLAETTHEKVRDGPPLYGSPRVVVSKSIPEIVAPGRLLMEATRYSGFACVEFKRDARDHCYKLMEVNARHNLAGMLHVCCGIDYPWIQYEHLVYGRKPQRVRAAEGFYWIDIYRDLAFSLRCFAKENLSIRDYLRPYLRPHVFRTLDWRDPLPFLTYPFQQLVKAIRPRS